MKPYEILKVNERLSNYIIVSDKDTYVISDIERRYPHQVQLTRHFGDWGLGASRTTLRFSHNTFSDYDMVDAMLVRWSNVNNPMGLSPGIIEGIHIDSLERREVVALRDALNTLLGEGNSEPEGS